MPILFLPTPLSAHLQGQRKIILQANTLQGCVVEIKNQYPALYRLIFAAEGRLNGFVNIYLNQELVSDKLASAQAVGAQDTLELVASVSGG